MKNAPETYQLDHIMWAGADLDATSAMFEEMAGVALEPGGSHPGLGTRNRLTGLGGRMYFEVIAPDPAQTITGTFGEKFLGYERPKVQAVIFGSNDLERVREVYRSVGIEVDIIQASRMTEGGVVRWRMLSVKPGPLTDHAPRFLDWLDSPHPSQRLRHECSFVSLRVFHPEPQALAAVWKAHGLDVPILEGPAAYEVVLRTPKGEIVLR